ncbi:MAG: hypothetical protein AUH30_13375 [Candidatus Rokubacteria bacterium 13_1_40CM_68_15]|nr:MAG: hypothetical protein AUH30_13375 [Candidatus Rokubacteria bacterium 13_1_40CM_68_15]
MTLLVIDTDPGVDDALALLLAWGSPGVRVEAVTTVAGNVPLGQCTLNLFRLLALRRPEPWPVVAAGADAPLARPLRTAEGYHGADGLGALGDWPEVEAEPALPNAIDLIVDMGRRHGERLTLVALGPLTNLALACEADLAAMRRIGRVVAMGGAVDVPGNVTPTAEFNFHVDPEAAARVLDAGLRLDLVPLDATGQATVTRAELERALGARPGPRAARVLAFTQHAFAREGGRLTLHDPLAVGAAFDETLLSWEPARLRIGGDGETRRAGGHPNCRIAVGVETERFVSVLLQRL